MEGPCWCVIQPFKPLQPCRANLAKQLDGVKNLFLVNDIIRIIADDVICLLGFLLLYEHSSR